MKIHRIEVHEVRLEMVEPFVTSFGRIEHRDLLVLKVHSDIGVTFSDVPVLHGPFYNAESVQTARHALCDFLGPKILEEHIDTIKCLHGLMTFVRGHYMAKSGLDTACQHLFAAQAGQSLSQRLGGARERIEVGISIGIYPHIDQLLDRVSRALDEGFARIKVKIKPGWDLEPLRAVRQAFGDIRLMADANSAYVPGDFEVFRKLDGLGLLMIEQPFSPDDLYQHSRLQKKIETPVCLDESVETLEDAELALAIKAGRVINIKLSRVGGLGPAVAIHDLCQDEGIPVWCGGVMETAIGQADCLALASLPNFQLPADIAPSSRYFERDLIDPFVALEKGTIVVPTGPGLGFEIDEKALNDLTLRKVTIE